MYNLLRNVLKLHEKVIIMNWNNKRVQLCSFVSEYILIVKWPTESFSAFFNATLFYCSTIQYVDSKNDLTKNRET